MVKVEVTVHPSGLHQILQAKAHHLHREEGMALDDVCSEVHNLKGQPPSKKSVWSSVQRMDEVMRNPSAGLLPETRYRNCGRKGALGDKEKLAIVDFVTKWRGKRFCTCNYIKKELQLNASRQTIVRALNEFGFIWKRVPKKSRLDEKQLKSRQEFWESYGAKTADWWVENLNVVLDGVTLTTAPKGLSNRQKHAAQTIRYNWFKAGEAMENDLHTHSRYGTQLGTKVPLWGGFTGGGSFSLRLWTEKPKMDKAAWAKLIPKVAGAADGGAGGGLPKVWHDNEKFLLQPEVYALHGLELIRFPPNSGDLNPIETVWAWLRHDLSVREQADLAATKAVLTVPQFKARAAQILHAYSVVQPGESRSRLEKLVRGMPKRMQQLKKNKFGRFGK